jgi:DNA-binding NtrC family response regulator
MRNGDPIRLLLVDDEMDFLESASKALSRRGFAVETAADGETALEILDERSFDIAVIDIKMPGIDGIELFHKIKHRMPNLPVVILTGHGTVQQAFETSKDGVFDYVGKPCDIEKLAAICREAVTSSSLAHEKPVAPEQAESLPIRVLVVDDEKDFRDAMSKVLARRGMVVATASDGMSALDQMVGSIFDVVILDLRMPGPSGLDVLAEIKKKYPTTEVILLTGHPSVALALRGLRQGAFDFVVKPQNVDAIARKIREAAARRREAETRHREEVVGEILKRDPR